MDILCLMGLYPKEYLGSIQAYSTIPPQYAADKHQWAIVEGLDQLVDVSIRIANSIYIGSYPKRYKKVTIPTFEFKHSDKAKGDINVGYCNLTGYKFYSRYITTKKVIEKWAEEDNGEEKVLLTYALATPFCQLADYVKKHYKNIKVCTIAPDLPDFMDTAQKKNLRFCAKKVEIQLLKRATKSVDGFIFLADAMKEWFANPVKYTVVEGVVSVTNEPSVSADNRRKCVLYAGGIKKEYGVVDLVEAFIKADNADWILEIYGGGDAEDEIKQLANGHENVVLKGFTPNSEVVEAQKTASILVNPRKNQVFTKYSFPSKVLEYMASGTPMLAYKIDGIPEEYDPYYYHIEDKEEGFVESLKKVMSLSSDERCEMGERARRFVSEFKNPKHQAQKMIDFIKTL